LLKTKNYKLQTQEEAVLDDGFFFLGKKQEGLLV